MTLRMKIITMAEKGIIGDNPTDVELDSDGKCFVPELTRLSDFKSRS
jgi:hypothetical protein